MRRQHELIGLLRSKVYYKPVQPSKEQAEWREKVMARLDYWHTTIPYIGTRKLVKQLQKEGFQVGRKLVRRLMDEMGDLHGLPQVPLGRQHHDRAPVPKPEDRGDLPQRVRLAA